MTKKALRRFLIVKRARFYHAIYSLLLTVLLFFPVSSHSGAALVKIEDSMRLLPAGIQIAMVLDVPQLMNLPFMKKFIHKNKIFERQIGSREFLKYLKTNIDFAIFAVSDTLEIPTGGGIMCGKIDLVRWQTFLKEKPKTIREEKIYGIKTFVKDNNYIAFLDSSKIAIGDSKFVRSVINNFKKRKRISKKSALLQWIKKTDHKTLFRGAMVCSPRQKEELIRKDFRLALLKPVEVILFSLHSHKKNLKIEIKAMTSSALAAKQLADSLMLWKTMASGWLAQDREIKQLLETVTIVLSKNYVKVHANMDLNRCFHNTERCGNLEKLGELLFR